MKLLLNDKKCFFLLLFYSLWIGSVFVRKIGSSDDFDVFFNAGKRLLLGHNVYEGPHLNQLQYFYSPAFACLMALLQPLGLFKVKLIWFLLNYLMLMQLIQILNRKVFSKGPYPSLALFVLLLITGKLVLFNFLSSQMTIFLCWSVLEAWQLMEKKHENRALLLLAVSCNVKILPLIVVPWLLRFNHRAPFNVLLFFVYSVLLLVLPFVFLGYDNGSTLTFSWLKTVNPLSTQHVMQTYEAGLMDLSAMLTKYLSGQAVSGECSVNLVDISTAWLLAIVTVSRLALLGLLIGVFYRMRNSEKGMPGELFLLFGLMALIPLCAPHQRYYSYLFFMPLLASLLNVVFQSDSKFFVCLMSLLLLFSGLMTWSDWVGPPMVDFYELYRINTLGFLMIFLVWLWVIPRFEIKKTWGAKSS